MQSSAQRRGRGTLLASLGAGLEYYDFVAYALLAPYLRVVFFPHTQTGLSTSEALGLFAVGYIARPLGGLFFGSRGDRRGRKNTFLHTTVLMAGATVLMGCLPGYARIGAWAPALLIALRFVQGFSFGGELPGAITFVAEHTPASRRGRGCASVISCVTLGSLMASLLLQGLSRGLGDAAMAAWGWRIVFWLGGSLAVVSWIARQRLHETPQFDATPRSAWAPLSQLLGAHRRGLAAGMCVALLGATLVIFPLYAPVYLQTWFNYAPADIYSATSVSLVWATFATLASGWLTDRFGARRTLLGAALLWMLAVPAVFNLLAPATRLGLYAFCLAWQSATSAVAGCYLTLLAKLFPPAVRYTGVALCYNVAFTLAGLAPTLFARLVDASQAPLSLRWVYVGFAALAVIALAGLQTDEVTSHTSGR